MIVLKILHQLAARGSRRWQRHWCGKYSNLVGVECGGSCFLQPICIYTYTYLSINIPLSFISFPFPFLSLSLSLCLSLYHTHSLSLSLSFFLSLSLSFFLSLSLSFFLSLSIYLSLSSPTHLPIHPSIHIHPSLSRNLIKFAAYLSCSFFKIDKLCNLCYPFFSRGFFFFSFVHLLNSCAFEKIWVKEEADFAT